MPKKITKITAKHIAKFPEYVKKWVDVGLSTEPANWEEAEKAVRTCYKIAGLPEPKMVLRADSPLVACWMGVLANKLEQNPAVGSFVKQILPKIWGQVEGQVEGQVLDQVWDQVRIQVRGQVLNQVLNQVEDQVEGQVWGQVRNQVLGQVEDQVAGQVEDQVLDQVRGQVWGQVVGQVVGQVEDQVEDQVLNQVLNQVKVQVWCQVLNQVRDQVLDQVIGQVRNQVLNQVEDQVRNQVAGQVEDQVKDLIKASPQNLGLGAFWSSTVSYTAFLRDEMRWENPLLENFKLLETLVGTCGYVWWSQDVAVIVNRPKEVHRDGAGRLHSITGPALSYPDGWALYRVHGVEVPSEWITNPETLNAKIALTWPNIEQRRVVMELYGWGKVLAELPTKIIDVDPDVEVGTLVEVSLPDSNAPSRFLQVQCGTGRKFSLCVPNNVKTALEANAWTFDVKTTELSKLEVRT